MRIYVHNTAKDLIVILADPDVDIDVTGRPVTFTGYDGFYTDAIVFGPNVITNKVYTPPAGDEKGYTTCTMSWTSGEVDDPTGDPFHIRLNVNIDWPQGPQDIRPLQLIKIRA